MPAKDDLYIDVEGVDGKSNRVVDAGYTLVEPTSTLYVYVRI